MITADSVWVFDLDGTLAESKQPIPDLMADTLKQLTKLHRVCILTGGTLQQIQTQVLDALDDAPVHAYGCSGSTYKHPNQPAVIEWIPELDRLQIMAVIEAAAKILGYWEEHSYGQIIEDRHSQITFSGLGQAAPLKVKELWDADKKKRTELIKQITPYLKAIGSGDYVAHIGGSTSIDITNQHHTKKHGIELICKHLSVTPKQIVYVGDELYEGGNDYPVTDTGVNYIRTRNWLHTHQLIKAALAKVS